MTNEREALKVASAAFTTLGKRAARVAASPSIRRASAHGYCSVTWETSGPLTKTSGIFGDSGLLNVAFRYWRCNKVENRKPSNTAKIRGLQGVKVVSAEGIATFNAVPRASN